MFELLIAVCVNATLCEYMAPQIAYESEASCRHQAALIAGTVAGRHSPFSEITWRFRCKDGTDSVTEAPWIEVVLAEIRD